MTAEVGVMNRNGIASAADSAITVGQEHEKIYTSADKLFQLSENAPIGIMFYGNVSLLNIPWETVVKVYRRRLRSQTFPYLRDYARDFIRFLKSQRQMFPISVQENFVDFISNDFYSYIRKNLEKTLEDELNSKGPLNERQIKDIFRKLLRDQIKETKGWPKFDHLPRNIFEIIKKKYKKNIVAARRKVFEKLPMSEATKLLLVELIIEILIHRRLEKSPLSSSGIVIAGFGEREHYPSLVEIAIAGIVAGYPLYSQFDVVEINEDMAGCVDPFAQREMVHTFMRGIDPKLENMIEDSTKTLFRKVTSIIIEQVKSKYPKYAKSLKKKVNKNIDKVLSELLQYWNVIRVRDYSNPVMEMVASLPKDELGAMAESLVNLTKFKRRVSKEHETVGGPIDVAVITKGDGFVWVKRKHYFKPELNPRFLRQLSQGNIK